MVDLVAPTHPVLAIAQDLEEAEKITLTKEDLAAAVVAEDVAETVVAEAEEEETVITADKTAICHVSVPIHKQNEDAEEAEVVEAVTAEEEVAEVVTIVETAATCHENVRTQEKWVF